MEEEKKGELNCDIQAKSSTMKGLKHQSDARNVECGDGCGGEGRGGSGGGVRGRKGA